MNFKIHPKEKLYFSIMVIASIMGYIGLFGLLAYGFMVNKGLLGLIMLSFFYLGLFILFRLFAHILFIGYIRGNGIRIHQKQFPEVFELFKTEAEKLGLKKLPSLYLVQGHGFLNAFAARYRGHNYVILYSEVFAAAYQEGVPAVRFIIGHELGHIVRNHLSPLKSLLLFPAKLIPFLGWAHSRACEYTCDNIGLSVCPEGAQKGLLILAAGKTLYNKVNVGELLLSAQAAHGFAVWFAEIFSSHPHIAKRIASIEKISQGNLPLNTFVLDKDKDAVRELNEHTL